jgi:hypothetical protein
MDKQTKSAAKRGRKGKAGGNPSTARDTEGAQENGHLKGPKHEIFESGFFT